jgi:DNA modification methylase
LKNGILYYGDNLDVLRRHVAAESIDLIYLDPPFNSNRSYNVLFRSRGGEEAQAQIQAFDDTWTWSPEARLTAEELITTAPSKVADAIEGLSRLLGENDVLAYLVMMTPRLLELHRVLRQTGSLYLHCDPTASHYLKIILDAIFGPTKFRNEIIWRRTGAHSTPRRFETIHDTIFFYTKSADYFYEPIVKPYTKKHVDERYAKDEAGRLKFVTGGNILTGPGATKGSSGQAWRDFDPSAKGRHWAIPGYLAEQMPPEFESASVLEKLEALFQAGLIEIKAGASWPHPVKFLGPNDGIYVSDIWAYQPATEGLLYGTDKGIDADVQWLGPTDPDRLGYQTQKPQGLLERIIRASCPPGGIVLDPFCGCGTTVAAAQQLGCRWIGIDITYLAIDLISYRLANQFGAEVVKYYDVRGIPRDEQGARALAGSNKFDFERWVVSLVGGQPNEKQVGDRGIDGVIKFPLGGKKIGRIVVSVKGGEHMGPSMVRDLVGAVQTQKAEMGLLISLEEPTRGMIEAVNHAGSYLWPVNNQQFPLVQLITVKDLMEGKRPQLPPTLVPYIRAEKLLAPSGQQYLELD